jgi:hypothetical protein
MWNSEEKSGRSMRISWEKNVKGQCTHTKRVIMHVRCWQAAAAHLSTQYSISFNYKFAIALVLFQPGHDMMLACI